MPTTSIDPLTVVKATPDLERFQELSRRGGGGAHSYAILLGLDTWDLPYLLGAIERGFAFSAFERLHQNLAVSIDQVADAVQISKRTLTRRKQEGRFLPEESDRLLRATRIYAKSLELFEGDRDGAIEWLNNVQPALGGAVPLDIARTDIGAREVEALIDRLEHGVFS